MENNSYAAESRQQFDKQADLYAISPVHRNGPSLPILVEYAAPSSTDIVLDVATGTGNTAFTLAPFVKSVVGVDVAEEMLARATKRAADENIANVRFQVGAAEHLPFEDQSFSLIVARHAPHHFRDVEKFLREVHRVLAPTGRFVMVDQISVSEDHQTWNEFWQQTRDPSHFKQRTISEWQDLAERTGFTWVKHTLVEYRMEFAWWVRQAGAPEEAINQLKEHARTAPQSVRETEKLEFEGDEIVAFTDNMLVVRLVSKS